MICAMALPGGSTVVGGWVAPGSEANSIATHEQTPEVTPISDATVVANGFATPSQFDWGGSYGFMQSAISVG
ncbi:hypothetical protein CA13_09790 [Planctomycetes bacterium CA13]|uniref:Uncharacterized protein n=1 Tax=Novipirellula herctigrandis TaxID=2527986 RepID=A0A5C5YX30_9BACT|nr:hypothetical protein CA13_09790 [Planctomycetes bacterium CA13]